MIQPELWSQGQTGFYLYDLESIVSLGNSGFFTIFDFPEFLYFFTY